MVKRKHQEPAILFAATEVFATGGIQRFNRNLLEAWHQNGNRVTVLTLKEACIDAVDSQQFPRFQFIAAGGNKLRYALTLLGLLIGRRYRYVVCGHLNLAPLTVVLCLLTFQRRKTSLILHGIEVWGRINGMQPYIMCYLQRVLAVSAYTRLSFLEQVACFEPASAVIFPNTLSHPLQSAGGVASHYHHGDGPFRLLSVTRLSCSERDKGLRDVMAALASLDDLDFEYVIVGDGDDRQELQDFADDLGISRRVEFCGRLDDEALWATYRESHAFILPSSKEGFGIVFLEAMRFGLPVIAAAEKGALDVVEHGKTGLLVDYGDVGSIAAAITRLIQDSSLRQRLVDNSFELILPGGKFSFDAFRNRTRHLFG